MQMSVASPPLAVVVVTLLAFVSLAFPAQARFLAPRGQSFLGWDKTYGKSKGKLSELACSDGSHGLSQRGYKTLDDLPAYPHVGGVPAVKEWNSPSCGSCWKLSHNGTSIHFLAIDVGGEGFVGSKAALHDLTHKQAQKVGQVDVTYAKVDPSKCGL